MFWDLDSVPRHSMEEPNGRIEPDCSFFICWWKARKRNLLSNVTVVVDNPQPLTPPIIKRTKVSVSNTSQGSDRDDNPQHWPQDYTLWELNITYRFPSSSSPFSKLKLMAAFQILMMPANPSKDIHTVIWAFQHFNRVCFQLLFVWMDMEVSLIIYHTLWCNVLPKGVHGRWCILLETTSIGIHSEALMFWVDSKKGMEMHWQDEDL